MIERLPDKRYRVLVSVWMAGKIEHTIPCRKLKCPICSQLQGNPVDRDFARNIEAQFEASLTAKRTIDSSVTDQTAKNIRDALERYKGKRGELGKSSKVYERLLDYLGDTPVESSWQELQAFIDRYKVDLGESTLNRHIAMVKCAIHECHETRIEGGKRLIADNYLSGFPTFEEQNREYVILSGLQIRDFWAALDARLKPYFYFACRVPVREGEAFNLTREHVDPFRKIILLPYEYTKQGGLRTIPILDELMPYTLKFWNSPAEYYFNRGESEGFQPLGYLNKSGKIEFSLRRQWAKACAAAKEPRFNMHKTRQQAVMSLWAQGWTEEEIRLYGGWAATSKAFYSYFDQESALHIRKGQQSLDTTWWKEFGEQLKEAA